MEILTITLVALGLTADTLAVSISSGLSINQIKFQQALRIAVVLAIFQGCMPIIGWLLGAQVANHIKEFDHWIAFLLLFFLGGKMIYESIGNTDEESNFNPLKTKVLIGISLATSIDALIVGVTFALIHSGITLLAFMSGLLTFLVAMVGLLIGKKTGSLFGKTAEIFGGIILIGIGLKVLIEHLFFQ